MSSAADGPPADPSRPPDWDRLELAARRLLDEHDAWQRRARTAEARVRELEAALDDVSSGDLNPVQLAEKVEMLDAANASLRDRLERARGSIRRILDRLQFLQEER